MVRQGVTTIVTGNCGHSPFPVGAAGPGPIQEYSAFLAKDLEWCWSGAHEYLAYLDGLPLALNVGLLVGLGTVRVSVMGFDDRAPTSGDLAQMREAVNDAMVAGALGVSTGLIYPPGSYASSDEVLELVRVAGRHGGFYASHLRNEGAALLAAVEEFLNIARLGGVPAQLSHHKVLGSSNWGASTESLKLIDAALASGLDLVVDQYPYDASSTTIGVLLPIWALVGGDEGLRELLGDPERRAALRGEVLHGPPGGESYREFEPETVMIASASTGPSGWVGHSLKELAVATGTEPVDFMLNAVRDVGTGIEIVIFSIGEEDLQRIMRHSAVAVASDGWTLDPSAGGLPHPRSYGTFTRVLGRYVRDLDVLDLADAVRKMTSLPARRIPGERKGIVSSGRDADLVVFDPATVADLATYAEPHRFCTGVSHVIVNGVPVVIDGEETGAAPGKVIKNESYR